MNVINMGTSTHQPLLKHTHAKARSANNLEMHNMLKKRLPKDPFPEEGAQIPSAFISNQNISEFVLSFGISYQILMART